MKGRTTNATPTQAERLIFDMSFYIVRVELHEVPEAKSKEVYDDLHDKMYAKGFLRQVSDVASTYDLPTGLYVSGTLDHLGTAERVDNLACNTAESTGYKASTTTIKAEKFQDFHWTGLKKAPPKPRIL